jgi:hypothetical protein
VKFDRLFLSRSKEKGELTNLTISNNRDIKWKLEGRGGANILQQQT